MTEQRPSPASDVQLRIDPHSRTARRGGGTLASSAGAADAAGAADRAEALGGGIAAQGRGDGPPVVAYELHEFAETPLANEPITLDRIRDVELDLKIELGRAEMPLQDVLQLRTGSVVPLNKLAGDPVDIVVNGRLVARGEVLVLGEKFCVRVTELMGGAGEAAAERAA